MNERFRVGLKSGERVLTEGVIDRPARYAFTHGYCGELALAVRQVTGWPLVATGAWADTGGGLGGISHVGVLTPDGLVLDIEGTSEPKVWAGRWGVDGAWAEIGEERLHDLTVKAITAATIAHCRAASFVEPVLALCREPRTGDIHPDRTPTESSPKCSNETLTARRWGPR